MLIFRKISHLKMSKSAKISKCRTAKMVKNAALGIQNDQKLISRKI